VIVDLKDLEQALKEEVFREISPGIHPEVVDITVNHSVRMAALAVGLGKRLGLSEEELERLIQICLLHDLGKVLIPSRLILKEGPLTSEEFEEVKLHPFWTVLLLWLYFPRLDERTCWGALNHHERSGGCGYPRKISLKEGSLDLLGGLVDVWEAILNDRRSFYRQRPVSQEEIEREFLGEGFISGGSRVILELIPRTEELTQGPETLGQVERVLDGILSGMKRRSDSKLRRAKPSPWKPHFLAGPPSPLFTAFLRDPSSVSKEPPEGQRRLIVA
jgi:hypothetical protein